MTAFSTFHNEYATYTYTYTSSQLLMPPTYQTKLSETLRRKSAPQLVTQSSFKRQSVFQFNIEARCPAAIHWFLVTDNSNIVDKNRAL